jgi:hypothetical protein
MRIAITDVPPGVPLVSGLTATVTIRDAEAGKGDDWLRGRLHALVDCFRDILHRPQPRLSCVPAPLSAMARR